MEPTSLPASVGRNLRVSLASGSGGRGSSASTGDKGRNREMTAPIEDVSSLPGGKVSDQEEVPIGEVKEIYAMGGDGYPM